MFHTMSALQFTAPSGFPPNFQVAQLLPRLFTLSWDPPLFEEQNGIIINYVVLCASNSLEILRQFTTSTFITVPDVLPFTTYACTVAAITEAGEGPPSLVISATTLQDGELCFPP